MLKFMKGGSGGEMHVTAEGVEYICHKVENDPDMVNEVNNADNETKELIDKLEETIEEEIDM